MTIAKSQHVTMFVIFYKAPHTNCKRHNDSEIAHYTRYNSITINVSNRFLPHILAARSFTDIHHKVGTH